MSFFFFFSLIFLKRSYSHDSSEKLISIGRHLVFKVISGHFFFRAGMLYCPVKYSLLHAVNFLLEKKCLQLPCCLTYSWGRDGQRENHGKDFGLSSARQILKLTFSSGKAIFNFFSNSWERGLTLQNPTLRYQHNFFLEYHFFEIRRNVVHFLDFTFFCSQDLGELFNLLTEAI